MTIGHLLPVLPRLIFQPLLLSNFAFHLRISTFKMAQLIVSPKTTTKKLTTMDDLMNYSWGPKTNQYHNFVVDKCRLLFSNTKTGSCKHYSCDGFTYTEDFLRGYYELKNFQAKEDDVFLLSFPKTGTTWLQEIVYVIMHGFEKAKGATIDTRVPFFEIFPGGMKSLENYSSPRLLKSHFAYSALPVSVKQKRCKMIYITRNPKDTITSMYHFYRCVTSFQFSGTLDEFVDMFINDQVMCAPYPEHILEFFERRHDSNILFLTYEGLQANLQGEVSKIAKFLGKTLTEERVRQIAHHCSFQQMSVNPSTNYSHRDKLGWRNLNETKFMRKGQVGDWMNHFSEEVNKKIDDWVDDHFGHTDINFDFKLMN